MISRVPVEYLRSERLLENASRLRRHLPSQTNAEIKANIQYKRPNMIREGFDGFGEAQFSSRSEALVANVCCCFLDIHLVRGCFS